jgi:hypothetical protein
MQSTVYDDSDDAFYVFNDDVFYYYDEYYYEVDNQMVNYSMYRFRVKIIEKEDEKSNVGGLFPYFRGVIYIGADDYSYDDGIKAVTSSFNQYYRVYYFDDEIWQDDDETWLLEEAEKKMSPRIARVNDGSEDNVRVNHDDPVDYYDYDNDDYYSFFDGIDNIFENDWFHWFDWLFNDDVDDDIYDDNRFSPKQK